MKALIILSILVMSSISFAAAKCPSDMKSVMTCKSAPQAGDSEVAIALLDSAAICSKDSKSYLILEKNGELDSREAKVVSRAGSLTYTIEATDTEISLSYATGIRPVPSQKAKLSILFKGAGNYSASSTYSCSEK